MGDMFNVGGSEEISIEQLATLIIDRTGSSSVDHPPAVRGGVRGRVRGHGEARSRCSQDRALTGWLAQRTLSDILDDVIEEVRAEREALALADDE